MATLVACLSAFAISLVGPVAFSTRPTKKWLIAHRGASAYAPENTLPAFQLALKQGAGFIEVDLQMTRDGVLVCLHDETLERTTNVEEVFPDRHQSAKSATETGRHWYVYDFDLQEIKQLDAGIWKEEKFRGTRIPTFEELINQVRGEAGLFVELKAPDRYVSRGMDMEQSVLAELKKNGLDVPGADPKTPIVIQSFNVESMRKLALELKTQLDLHLLVSETDEKKWFSPTGLANAREFVVGISPAKGILLMKPGLAAQARHAGLRLTPYTFRAGASAGFNGLTEEMFHYLYELQVEGVITDNPDLFPGQ